MIAPFDTDAVYVAIGVLLVAWCIVERVALTRRAS